MTIERNGCSITENRGINNNSSDSIHSSESLLFDNYINKKQLSAYIGMSVGFINDWLSKGLPYHKFGRSVRFRLSEVQTWLDRRHVNG